MDLGLEHIVSAKTERFEMGVDYIDSFIEFQNSCESFGEFLNYGKNLIVAFENVSDIKQVIRKYGVTESLISLVGSNFISMEDESSAFHQDPNDPDSPNYNDENDPKKEDAEKVKSGVGETISNLWKKIVAWFKDLFEKFMNWINHYTVMYKKAYSNIKNVKDPGKEFTYKGVDGKDKTVAVGSFSSERSKIESDLKDAWADASKGRKDLESKKSAFAESKKNLSEDEVKAKKEEIANLRKELNGVYSLGRQQIALVSAFCAAANKAGKGGEAKEEKPAEGEEKK